MAWTKEFDLPHDDAFEPHIEGIVGRIRASGRKRVDSSFRRRKLETRLLDGFSTSLK